MPPPLSIALKATQYSSGSTESQNGWGSKGPLWVTQPNPLLKEGHPEQAAQHRGQAGLEHLQRRRLHSLPGQLLPAELFELALRRGW